MRTSSDPVRRAARVAVVDDHPPIGLAVQAALRGSAEVVYAGVWPSVDALLRAASRVDLVLLDLRLADGASPADGIARLRTAGAEVLVYTSGESPSLLRLAAAADVVGILAKAEPIDVLVATVEAAAAGRPLPTALWAHAVATDPLLDEARLSRQEARILTRFADGAGSVEVAAEVGITVGTLEDYVRRIRTKYARVGRTASTKVDLYKRAVEDGYLPLPGAQRATQLRDPGIPGHPEA